MCTVYWRAAAIGEPRALASRTSSGLPRRQSRERGYRDESRKRSPADGAGMGVHVLDVLVRPVESIPEGAGALVEEIRA